MITPDLFGIMRLAARREVRKYDVGIGRDREGELLEIQLDQRHAQSLRIRDPDRVERDIDPTRRVDHRLQMPVHGLLVKSVDLRRVGGSAGRLDFVGNRCHGRPLSPGKKNLGPFPRKRARHGAADRTSCSVDHRNLLFQHHLAFLSVPGRSPPTSLVRPVVGLIGA
jgi:hypothetical protein